MNENKDTHSNDPGKNAHIDSKGAHKAAPIFKEFTGDDALSRYDLKKAFLGAQRHLLTILLTSILFTCFGAYFVYRYMKSYSADALILFEGDAERKLPGGYIMSHLALPAAVEMIKLQSNLYAVKSILGLDLSVSELDKMIKVDVPKGTSNLIWITVKSDNPNLAVDIANTLAKVVVKDSQEFTRKEIQRVRDSFNLSYESSKQNVNARLNDIEQYKKTNEYFEMDAQFASLINRANTVKQSLQSAEISYNSLLEEYQSLKADVEKLPEQVPTTELSISNPDNPFQSRMAALEAALIDARSKYSEQNPKIQILQDEMTNLQKEALSAGTEVGNATESKEKGMLVKNTMKSNLQVELLRMYGKVKAAEAMKEDLEKTNESLQQQLKSIPEKQVELAKLLQARDIAEQEMEYFKNSLQSLDIMLQSPKGYIEIFQLADKANTPNSSWAINLIPIVLLFLGALAGYCLAAVKELMKQTLCTVKEIELAYHLPCLIRIPEIKGLNPKNTYEKMIYYIRKLVEHIQHINRDHYSTILMASSISREGKSSLGYCLALYYKKLGKNVVYIDFDYRRNPYLEISNGASLDAYLQGKATIEDIITHDSIDSIKMIQADVEMNEMIKSKYMSDLISTLKSKYDHVIMEAPGILEDDYSLNIASYADMCLLVIGSSKVNKQQVDTSLKELDLYEKRPFGIILNRVLDIYMGDKDVRVSRKFDYS